MENIALPVIDHPDFPPGTPTRSWERFGAPPPNILRSMAGPRPYMPVVPTSLKVGDTITLIGFGQVQWPLATITNIMRHGEFLRIITDLPSPLHPSGSGQMYTFYILPEFPELNSWRDRKWVYRLTRLKPDEAKGLAEISNKYQLPHDVTGKIKEAITGSKPTRFQPGSKTGGTRKAKGRRYRKRAGRPLTQRRRPF